MSPIRTATFGALAVAAMLGAVQLASGHDLMGGRGTVSISNTPVTAVNRAAKADRTMAEKAPAAPSRTVALRLHDLADTSVLVRLPLAEEARGMKQPASMFEKAQKPVRRTVACEPVVSVLTEVAKLLQPGRCVT